MPEEPCPLCDEVECECPIAEDDDVVVPIGFDETPDEETE